MDLLFEEAVVASASVGQSLRKMPEMYSSVIMVVQGVIHDLSFENFEHIREEA